MDYVQHLFQATLGLAVLLLVLFDRQFLRWLNRTLDKPAKRTGRRPTPAAKRAGSLDRLARSRYYK